MEKENEHNLIKSAYIVGALLLVIGVVSSIGLFFGNEENGTNEQISGATTKTNLSGEEKRQIEESVSGGAALSVNASLEEKKKKIETNFNNSPTTHERSDEGERIKY
ncbi:MAG: hypothetical protein AAB523_00715 [Patescibacteria group bacterium]